MIARNDFGIYTTYDIGPAGEAKATSHWIPCDDGMIRGFFVEDVERLLKEWEYRYFVESLKGYMKGAS